MQPTQAALHCLAFVASAAGLFVAEAQPPTRTAESASEDVPAAIAERARSLVERSTLLRSALVEDRTVFVGVDLVRRKGRGDLELPPLYRVRHYRYSDDAAITSLVDLRTGRIAEQVEERHAAVPLSAAELDEARALAMRDPQVARALAPHRKAIVAEPLVVRTSDPEDPWFGRRVVRLLFRVGRAYISEPLVYVDLTRREVITERAHRPGHGEDR